MRQNIVLIGMMGAGKTAVGTDLARRLEVGFVDTDAEIERAASMTITEIFARDGEPFFRDRESEVLHRVLSGPPAIISTGGGAWMREANRDAVADKGIAVWLDPDLSTLWHRVQMRPTRPLLQTADPRGTLERLLNERRPTYALADVIVPIRRKDSVKETTARVMEAIEGHLPGFFEPKKLEE